MNKNGLFLISAGCLFILLSYMMATPVYLIATGIVCILAGLSVLKKNRRRGGSRS